MAHVPYSLDSGTLHPKPPCMCRGHSRAVRACKPSRVDHTDQTSDMFHNSQHTSFVPRMGHFAHFLFVSTPYSRCCTGESRVRKSTIWSFREDWWYHENSYCTEMCSGSEAGSYLRLTDFVYHRFRGGLVFKARRLGVSQ